MKCISLVFVKYCPALDENLEAWVQNITLGNNRVATKFTFCCQVLSLLQESSCCRWGSWRWGLDSPWVSRKQTGGLGADPRPPVLWWWTAFPALGVGVTLESRGTGEQAAMQWCWGLFLPTDAECWDRAVGEPRVNLDSRVWGDPLCPRGRLWSCLSACVWEGYWRSNLSGCKFMPEWGKEKAPSGGLLYG